jgi:hypothetical protein
VGRIWKAFGLRPHGLHVQDQHDPQFFDKVRDIVGKQESSARKISIPCLRQVLVL